MIEQIYNYFTTDILYMWVNLGVLPFWLLIITPILVIISIPISFYLFVINKNFLNKLIISNNRLYNFLLNKWYFDELYDFLIVTPLKKLGYFFWNRIDINIIDKYGPNGLAKLFKYFSTLAIRFQNGFIFHYAFVMLLGFSIILTYLILI